jgi:hypothetical protein
MSRPEQRKTLGPQRLHHRGRGVAGLGGQLLRLELLDHGIGVEQAPVRAAGILGGREDRLGRAIGVAGHEEVAPRPRRGARLAERHDAAPGARLREDTVELALHHAVRIGEREQERLAIRVEHRGLGVGVDDLLRHLLLLGKQVELVKVVPGARRNGRIRLVARAQDRELVFHRAQDLSRKALLRRERAEELAGLLHQQRLVAHGQLGREVAREGERLARARRERQE